MVTVTARPLLSRLLWWLAAPLHRAFRRDPRARLLWARLRGTRSTSVWVSLLRPGMTVIDLGANAGYYTFFASHAVGSTGRVLAFEPFPAAFSQLQSEAARFKHRNVELFNMAVSDAPGTHRMFVMPGHSPSNSLHPVPGLTADDGPEIQAVRVDDVLPGMRADVVKIDVEGHELHALKGMKRLLSAAPPPLLFIEFNPDTLKAAGTDPAALVGYLHSLGMSLYPIDERSGRVWLAKDAQALIAGLPADGIVNMVAAAGLPRALKLRQSAVT